jgi:hypothetical protein
MKIIIGAIMAFFISFVSCHSSIAGQFDYACRVINIYDLEDDGSLRISNWSKQFKGRGFLVSRITGEIIGEVVPTLLANSTKVINKGNKNYSFKSIGEFDSVNKPLSSGTQDAKGTASTQLLEIQEFRRGNKKPFVATSIGGAVIVTGLCR